MRKIALIGAMLLTVTMAGYSQQATESTGEPKPIGLTAKLDYVSTYLWRGTYFFDGDGAFLPTVTWNIFDTGAVVSVIGEFSSSWLFLGNRTNFNSLPTELHGLTRGVDLGADYGHTFENTFTLGCGFWYNFYNHARANVSNAINQDFFTVKGFAKIDILPLQPTVTFYYDYYTVMDRGGDFYVSLTLSHNFPLTSEVTMGIVFNTGYYYKNTAARTTFNGTSTYTSSMIKGFSDMSTLLTMTYRSGLVSIISGIGYVAVPASSWRKGSDAHRWYATFGSAVNF